MALTKAQVKKIVLAFPGANESTSYRYPSYKIEKKFFTRLRSEDNSLVLVVSSIDERDMLLEADPKLFHITAHYKNYPTVLARIERLDGKTLHVILERRWRQIAPKRFAEGGRAKSVKSNPPLEGGSKFAKQRAANFGEG